MANEKMNIADFRYRCKMKLNGWAEVQNSISFQSPDPVKFTARFVSWTKVGAESQAKNVVQSITGQISLVAGETCARWDGT